MLLLAHARQTIYLEPVLTSVDKLNIAEIHLHT